MSWTPRTLHKIENALQEERKCWEDHADNQLSQFKFTVENWISDLRGEIRANEEHLAHRLTREYEERLADVNVEIHHHLEDQVLEICRKVCGGQVSHEQFSMDVNGLSARIDNLQFNIDAEQRGRIAEASSILDRVNAQRVHFDNNMEVHSRQQEVLSQNIADLRHDLLKRAGRLDADIKLQEERMVTLSNAVDDVEQDAKTRVAELAGLLEETRGLWERYAVKVFHGPDMLEAPTPLLSGIMDLESTTCVRSSLGDSLAHLGLPSMQEEPLTSQLLLASAEEDVTISSDVDVCVAGLEGEWKPEVSSSLEAIENELQLSSTFSPDESIDTTKTWTGSVSSRNQERDIEESTTRELKAQLATTISLRDLAERLDKESGERRASDATFEAWLVRIEREVKDLNTSLLTESNKFAYAPTMRNSSIVPHVGSQNTLKPVGLENGEDTFREENSSLREKLVSMMDGAKSPSKKKIPVPVSSEGSSPMVGLRSSRGGTPHAPHVVGQVGAPVWKGSASLSMPSSGPISSGVSGQVSPAEGVSAGDGVNKAVGLDATVEIPVTVNVEPWRQHVPQHQPQQHSTITKTPTLSPRQTFPHPLSGSVNLPIAHSVDASMTLPVGSVHMRARGGSVHMPSVGPIWCSATNSSTQQQLASLRGSSVGSRLQERVVSSSPIPSFLNPPRSQTMPSANVLPAPAPPYIARRSINSQAGFTMQHSIPGDNLTRSIGRQQWCPPERSRSLERLGATVSPSSLARQVAGMSLSRAATAGTTSSSTA